MHTLWHLVAVLEGPLNVLEWGGPGDEAGGLNYKVQITASKEASV